MGIAYIERNQKVLINNVAYNILRELHDDSYQLEEINSGKFEVKNKNELLELLSSGNLSFVNENNYISGNIKKETFDVKSLDLYSEEIQEKARQRYAYMTGIKSHNLNIFTEESLKPVIDEIWEKLGKIGKKPHWSTVYRWYKKFNKSGNDIRALVDRNNKKGNRIRRYPVEVLEIVRNSVNEIYLTRERYSVKDVLEHAIYRVSRENKLRPNTMKLRLPTRSLVEKEIKSMPALDVCVARYGRQYAIRKFRSVENVYVSERILETVEIDHTKLALFVVDEERMLPLGRPWLTICIDNYSRSILGIYIGFAPPSYLTVAKCFKHAILPKTDLRKEYPNITNDWHSYGVMEFLVVDNAFEFFSNHLEAACHPFGVSIQFTPRKTPWFKGKIERLNETLEDGVASGVPGRTFHNILEKDDYDVAKKATITLSTLREIINLWIVDYYHQDIHTALGKTPYQAWTDSAETVQIALPENINDLDSLLGSITTRTLSHVGIEIFRLKYNSPELRELRIQYGDTQKVKVRYNEDDISYIYVIHPVTEEAIKVQCVNKNYVEDLDLHQHKIIRKFALKYIKDNKNVEALCEAKEKLRELVKQDIFNKKSKSCVRAERFLKGRKLDSSKKKLTKLKSTVNIEDKRQLSFDYENSHSNESNKNPYEFRARRELKVFKKQQQ